MCHFHPLVKVRLLLRSSKQRQVIRYASYGRRGEVWSDIENRNTFRQIYPVTVVGSLTRHQEVIVNVYHKVSTSLT